MNETINFSTANTDPIDYVTANPNFVTYDNNPNYVTINPCTEYVYDNNGWSGTTTPIYWVDTYIEFNLYDDLIYLIELIK